jgi:RHS repeat-associated protein
MAERANPGKITGVKNPLPERQRVKRTSKDIRGLWTAKEARDHSNRIHDLNLKIALAEEEEVAAINLDEYLALFMQMSTPNSKQDGGAQPWENSSGGVNTATGGFQTVVPISSWPTKGNLVVDFHLIHSSKGQVTATQFGKRWKSSYDYFLHLTLTQATLEFPDGTSVPRDRSGNSTTKPAGYYEEISYNTTTSKWEMKTKDQTVYQFSNDATFDANFWFLTKITDRFGNYITINRGTAGRLLEVVDGANSSRAIEVVLPMSGNDLSLVDSMRGTTWDLDKNATTSTLTEVVYPAVGGSMPKRKFEYNTVDQITKDTDRRDKPTIYEYNGSGGDEYDDFTLATAKDPELNTTTYTYVKHPTLDQIDYTDVTDPTSTYVRDTYDADGMLEYSVDGEGWWDLVVTRNTNHEVTKLTQATAYDWLYTYDSMGNVLTVTNPLSQVDTYTYNSTNDVLTYKNNANKTWTYTYYGTGTTAPGSLKEVTDPLTRTYPIAKFTRNAAGEPTEIFDGENLKTEIAYNSHGDVTSVKAPDGTETTSFYGTGTDYNKNRGNALRTTSAAGVTTSFVYDNWLRVTDVYAGDNPSTGTYEGDRTQIAYNAESAVTSTIDANSKTTTFSYDDNNDLISKTNAKSETETYARDGRGHVTSITNGRGKTRTYEYSGRGEVISLRLPGNTGTLPNEQYSYDGRGMLSDKTNAIGTYGQTVTYSYNVAGNLTKIDYPTGTDTDFTYDSRGRRSTMVDVTGTTTWTYNDADEVTQIAQPNGTISYEWRDNGQPKKRTEPGSVTVTFGYDSYGRPTTTTRADSSWNDTTTIAYDSYGRPLTKTLDNTTKEHYEYDSLSRLNKVMVKNSAGTTTLRSQNWVYDGVGNMTSRTIEGVTTTYSYDNIHQLITESRSGSLLEYTYDANGNRLTKKVNSTTVQDFTDDYSDDDRLTENEHGTITYDAAGRPTAYPTASGTKYFTWDYDDRLLGYSNTSGGALVDAQKYNGAGARVEFSSGGTTRKDLRTGIGVTAPVVSSAVGGSTTVSYLPGIAEKRGSTKSYQHSGLKNVDAQSNSSATISATREYDAFGGVITGSGTTGTFNGPFGHAGDFGYQSEGSGLQLLGHRWYDPEVGRFLTRDPIQDGKNWYAYCDNNPLGRVDPTGLAWHDPLQIRVDPLFPGKVVAVGEPGKGKGPGYVTLTGGQATDPGMDVDYVLIYDKEGNLIDVVFLPGAATPLGPDHNQHVWIEKDGSITGNSPEVRPGDLAQLGAAIGPFNPSLGKELIHGEAEWQGLLREGLKNPLKDRVRKAPSRSGRGQPRYEHGGYSPSRIP